MLTDDFTTILNLIYVASANVSFDHLPPFFLNSRLTYSKAVFNTFKAVK